MRAWREGGEAPGSPAGALIHRGFSHQPHGARGPGARGGAAVFKTTTLSEINRRCFTFQLSIQSCVLLQLRADLTRLTAVKAQGFVGLQRGRRACGALTRRGDRTRDLLNTKRSEEGLGSDLSCSNPVFTPPSVILVQEW